MEEKIMRKNRSIFFVLSVCIMLLSSCQDKKFEYRISDSYSGACLVFIYPSNEYSNSSNYLIINNGLGRISDSKMKEPFIFKSIENEKEIKTIPIGELNKAFENIRYIFQLLNGSASSNCSKHDINTVTFFVGTKKEYEEYSTIHQDDFEYFEKKGTDWCKYYKNVNIK